MAIIVTADSYLVDLEVETVRTDAVQAFVKQETVLVEIGTDDGLHGTGYAYTIGTGGRAVLSMLQDHLVPRLLGQDACQVEAIWLELFASTRATTTGVITSLALSAIDTALWDLKGLRAGEPLWQLAGGFNRRVPIYDTEGGWMQLGIDELVASAARSKAAGMRGVKIKVGKPFIHEDVERLLAVREVIGADMDLMLDANQSMTCAEARRRASAFEVVQPAWLEEPLPADDLSGHVSLANATNIPIAVGESLYSIAQFKEYLHAGAAGILQVDVARVGGVTPWLKVAHMAEAYNVVVCPHFLMELHVSLAAAIPNGRYVEHIPQLRAITLHDVVMEDGYAIAPSEPGLGITWDRDALDARRVS
ncbi:MAG: 3,6-anhydro-alpha-L-galactonate cycloisomerase [Nitrospira sp.]|nr:3,6-anhydro-alpha-L-galactonate cycloisomerase [Nitrospira sp.]